MYQKESVFEKTQRYGKDEYEARKQCLEKSHFGIFKY